MKPVKTKKIVHQQKRVKESSRLLVSHECFMGRTKFRMFVRMFVVRHLCFKQCQGICASHKKAVP